MTVCIQRQGPLAATERLCQGVSQLELLIGASSAGLGSPAALLLDSHRAAFRDAQVLSHVLGGVHRTVRVEKKGGRSL